MMMENAKMKQKLPLRQGNSLNSLFFLFLTLSAMLGLAGCGDFFEEKSTELESRNTLRELNKIDPAPQVEYPGISALTKKTTIIETKVGDKTDARLYYFTKYHTADKLAELIDTQFIKKFFDDKGKSYPVIDYNVSPNLATNQLIIRCPSVTDAKQVLEFLENADVPPVQVRIDCLISEVYADHTMDWETTLQIQNLFGEGISLGGDDGNPAFPGAALRDAARATFGLKAGVERNNFEMLVDMLVSRGYLKILMNPTLEVVNGQTAKIETKEHVPLDEISNVHPTTGVITTSTSYVDVVDSLEITPYVFADGYIGLKTEAIIGSKSTPEGVKQTPIVTERKVKNSENRIRQGESLIIGGITKTEKRSVIRGVPFLKEIPLLGVLFSSKDLEERGKEVLFILTPTISNYGTSNEHMVEEIRERHNPVTVEKSLTQHFTNPFSDNSYTEMVEEEATQAEIARTKIRLEMTQARRQIEMLTNELEKATNKIQREKQISSQSKSELENIRKQIEKANADLAEAQKKSEEIEKQSKTLKDEATKAKTEAIEAAKRALEAEKQAQKATEEARKLKEEAIKKAEAVTGS
jgi:hypothetical protein